MLELEITTEFVENLLIEVFILRIIFNTDRIIDEIFCLHWKEYSADISIIVFNFFVVVVQANNYSH